MASKWVKASDNNTVTRVITNSKRKLVSQIVKTSYKAPAVKPSLSSLLNKTLKRKRDDNRNKSTSTCSYSSSKNLLKNYSDFKKSGLPQRLLFREDGKWNDFSQEIIELAKEHFMAKTTAFEVVFNGRHLMLDILHMNEIDLESGLRKRIAWIDEKGSCFFPESYSYESLKDIEIEQLPEIKLHVEIELNENNNLEECVEESNVKRVKVDNQIQNLDDQQQLDAKKADNQCVKKIIQIDEEEDASPTSRKTLDEETVRNMIMESVSQSQSQSQSQTMKVDVMEVKKCSSDIMEMKLDLFHAQAEMTKKIRGNANVQYGWFASPVGSTGVLNGLGHEALKLGRYGYGVHLTADHSAHTSDNDENGERCMVLCRVILGNTEVVLPGSKQFYPSKECYDSGVDNLENPSHYVVWNTNMTTHIYPEYVVTYKMPPTAQGNMIIEGSRVDLSKVTTHNPNEPSSSNKLGKNEMQFESGSVEKIPSVGSSTAKGPNSPWMPFSKLFEAISDKVDPDNMKKVHVLYESLRGKKTSREEFIKNLRAIVGDQILRSTISSLQSRA